jgi:hypothetical protein
LGSLGGFEFDKIDEIGGIMEEERYLKCMGF